MSDERPDALLKSALEKIVYFEARAEQLHGELDATREEVQRVKKDLADAHQRELELRRELAELEVRIGRAQAEREDLTRLNQALRGERHQLMDKLLDASRIRASGQERDVEDDDLGFDLASFISQLRSEALLRPSAPGVAVPRGASVPVETAVAKGWEPVSAGERAAAEAALGDGLSRVAREAQRFHQEGRLGVSARQLAELSGHSGLAGSTDETLFGFSVRELSASDPAARVRAAERLKALSQAAAAPALATALHAETDATVQVALLQAFAGLCREEGASVVSPLMASPVPEVRIAALKAMLTVAPKDAAPHLAQATKDPDRSVRRRASLLALGLEGESARRLGEEAIHDADPETRALGALALGAGSGEKARTLLLEALGDREPRVRKAAAQSLSRILGQDVSAVVALDETHRRREIRRLATLPVKPVRARLEAPAPVVARAVAPPVEVAVPALAVVGVGAAVVASPVHAAQALLGPAQAVVVPPPSVVTAPVEHVVPPSAPRAVAAPSAGQPPVARPTAMAGAMQPAPVQAPVAQPTPSAAQAPAARLSPVQAALLAMGAGSSAPAPRAPTPVAPQAPEHRPPSGRPAASPVESLCGTLLADVRASVRGRSLAELTSGASASVELAQEALTLLVARGAVVRRGHKYFAA